MVPSDSGPRQLFLSASAAPDVVAALGRSLDASRPEPVAGVTPQPGALAAVQTLFRQEAIVAQETEDVFARMHGELTALGRSVPELIEGILDQDRRAARDFQDLQAGHRTRIDDA